MHRITLLAGLCMSCLLMTAACEGGDPAQQAGGNNDQAVEEVREDIGILGEAQPLEREDQAIDEASRNVVGAAEEAGASDEASEEKAEG